MVATSVTLRSGIQLPVTRSARDRRRRLGSDDLTTALPGHPQEFVPDHLVWAILTILFCCLPAGIVSTIYASQVDRQGAAGDVVGARESAIDDRSTMPSF